MIKWNAIAYYIIPDNLVNENSSKYMHYKQALEKVHEFEDNSDFQYFYGNDYSINQFFSDVGMVGLGLNEMLEVIKTEDIDKVFIIDYFFYKAHFDLVQVLEEICKERNIELIFPYQKMDNVSYEKLHDINSYVAV